MEFPILVYISPGQHDHPNGGTYNFQQINSQDELQDALQNGWYMSSAEAINPPETIELTRDELLFKAAELGIKHPKNISSAKLYALIDEAS